MIELTLAEYPKLLEVALEPTERLPVAVDVGSRLDTDEVLESATCADGGKGIASNVSAAGTVVSLDVSGLVNGTLSVLIITAIGAAGTVVRCALVVRCIDPANRITPEVFTPTGALIYRGDYVPEGIYRQYDVVVYSDSGWVALVDSPLQPPGVDPAEWDFFGAGDPLPQALSVAASPEFADVKITTLAVDSFFGNAVKSVLSWINTFTAWLKTALTDAGRDTGYLTQNGTISLPSATQISAGADHIFYQKGKKVAPDQVETISVTNATGISYIGRAALTAALVSSGQAWTRADFLAGFCSVAITHGFSNHLVGFEERHNYGRDINRHMNDHAGRGAYIDPTGFIRTAPSAASPNTLNLSSGSLFDEDLHTPIAQSTTLRQWWRAVGGASLERAVATGTDPRKMNGDKIRWDNGGTLTDGTVGKFYPYFVYAAPEKWASSGGTTGIYVVVAQGEYANAAAAKAAPRPTLPGFPTNELVLLYVVPYKQATANSVTLADADIVDWRASQLGGSASTGTFSAVASAISVDATGFNGNLATTDTDLQKVAQKVDDLVASGGSTFQSFYLDGQWAKPAGCNFVLVRLWGAGGGGGGGIFSSSTAEKSGGGGGGGGGSIIQVFPASACGDTETVTIGAGGLGGQYAPSFRQGATGGTTSFGNLASATGGAGGSCGSASSTYGAAGGNNGMGQVLGISPLTTTHGLSGTSASCNTSTFIGGCAEYGGGAGGGCLATTSAPGKFGGRSLFGGGGGGGGGGAGLGQQAGGEGGSIGSFSAGGGGGGIAGAVRTNGGDGPVGNYTTGGHGGGGGGGSSSNSVNAGNGGAGAVRGGGGGGGGAGISGGAATASIGGTGGNGYCEVIAW